MQDFRNLDVWKKAHAFTLKIYGVTETFPKIETFGLAANLRKGSANIAMKIAEGCGQATDGAMTNCLKQARAICMDVDYQLLLSHDLHFIEPNIYQTLQDQLVEVRRMLSGLLKDVPV
jgi:four helix bundle protein